MLSRDMITKVASDARRSMGLDFIWRPKTAQAGPINQGGAVADGMAEKAMKFFGVHGGGAKEALEALKQQFSNDQYWDNAAHQIRVLRHNRWKDNTGTAVNIAKLLGLDSFTKPIATKAGEEVTKRLFKPDSKFKHLMKEYPLMMYPAIGGGILAAGSGLEHGAEAAGGYLHERATRNRDFKGMLDQHPEVAEDFQSNPKAVRTAFETIRKYNKEVSSDPLVTGFLVHNAVTGASMQSGTPMIDMETASKLFNMRSEPSRPSNLGGAFQRGAEKAMPGVE